ncbi:hypothetical protein SPRG_02531 [Saprolegnia parasitica CBS 223.65]|uniref:WW domain-containing protein n=1 Tax=Saprolegnia parasitica (strain CBS 223.65) TaxID=695850 RepID=A0A067CQR2_SAPPC|nr:hypothetical protein SPRG_02531 [Saprolegnia parasitica CBS 223.65]KDO32838.1 hypothetical protein SPRG_02531 [Saprolegnia parasitica CBS 223.65]|eukprot:XP_012196493.1 hypothetical protein SPRG_02531 [Saprolegnia parasitica CBS 223.65]
MYIRSSTTTKATSEGALVVSITELLVACNQLLQSAHAALDKAESTHRTAQQVSAQCSQDSKTARRELELERDTAQHLFQVLYIEALQKTAAQDIELAKLRPHQEGNTTLAARVASLEAELRDAALGLQQQADAKKSSLASLKSMANTIAKLKQKQKALKVAHKKIKTLEAENAKLKCTIAKGGSQPPRIKGGMSIPSVFKSFYGNKGKSATTATNGKTVTNGTSRPGLNRVESKARVITSNLPPQESFNLDSLPEAPLPMGWEAKVSRNNGKVYYVNKSLKLTQWDRPTIETLKLMKQKKAQETTAAAATPAAPVVSTTTE